MSAKTILVSILFGQEKKNEKIEFGFTEAGFYLTDCSHKTAKEVAKTTGQVFPFRHSYTLRELQQYHRTHPAIVGSAKELFPDWNTIPVGQWSFYGFGLDSSENDEIQKLEFGLFHEWESNNYNYKDKSSTSKDITLNIFMGDKNIFCHSILL